jgi:hypothetical protein
MVKIKRKSNGMYMLEGKPLYGISMSRNVQYVEKLVKDYNSSLDSKLLEAIKFLDAYEQAEKSNLKSLNKLVDLTEEQKKNFQNSRNAERRDFYSQFFVEGLDTLESSQSKKVSIDQAEEESIEPVKTFSIDELAKLSEEYFKKKDNGESND